MVTEWFSMSEDQMLKEKNPNEKHENVISFHFSRFLIFSSRKKKHCLKKYET